MALAGYLCKFPHIVICRLCGNPHKGEMIIDPPKRAAGALIQWLALVGAGIVALGVSLWIAERVGTSNADRSVLERGEATTQLQVSALLAELDKQRAVRFLLARDADGIETLSAPSERAIAALNVKLKTLSEGARASVIYVINTDGLAIAASNFDTSESFVGNNYRFRPYFLDAMASGTGQLFAMGATSLKPGLYVSERIEGPNGPLGVAVVKIDFTALEQMWTPSNAATYVVDPRGVVLLSSVPSWQFNAETEQSPEAIAALRQSLQYLEAPLSPLPIAPHPDDSGIVTGTIAPRGTAEPLAAVSLAVPTIDWTLTALFSLEKERTAAVASSRAVAVLVVTAGMLLAALGLGLSHRARRRSERLAAQREALEAAVSLRTADLAQTNQQLMLAIHERDAAEQKAARLRDDLAQANRLASLGQIAAGVAHEINQPLGAIRAYADNGTVFLDRADVGSAKENLGAIARLTERIGSITDHLKSFARKGQGQGQVIDLRDSIDAALALLNSSTRNHGVTIDYERANAPAPILADETGVEQIIVNLIQNAVEALSETANPRIMIKLRWGEREVLLSIADNGPGVSADIAEQLFTPFSTSKAKGLGLGLVISQDLAQSFGARLTLDTSYTSGARFVLSFPRSL
jgi:two-component system C4-dicarboxylate transport sensor histidine kinase DctB